ncbi:MAG TPA: 30S ribosomal protein S2, partial [Anaerolineae bacterium]
NELERLELRLGGLRTMPHLPDALFIVDVQRESLAVTEANKLNIPVIAMVDTNCDPDPITYPIPSNDDAIRAIKLMAGKIADAVAEGMQLRAIDEAEQAAASDREAAEREEEEEQAQRTPERRADFERGRQKELAEAGEPDEYLGPSILARLAAEDFGDEEQQQQK